MRNRVNEEVFKEIEGYSEYRVSNLGRIIDKDGNEIPVYGVKNGQPSVFLKPDVAKGTHKIGVSVLVRYAFVPNPHGSVRGYWIDGDRTNNRADNLAWGITRRSRLKPRIPEVWKQIPGVKEGYEISDLGRIRFNTGEQIMTVRYTEEAGRPVVRLLTNSGKSVKRRIIDIVWEVFVKRPLKKGHSLHNMDFNKYNNALSNLEEIGLVTATIFSNSEDPIAMYSVPEEVWRHHSCGLFVSNLGRVKDEEGNIISPRVRHNEMSVIVAPFTTRDGLQVSRLVREAFVENTSGARNGYFLDGNRRNLRADNMAWAKNPCPGRKYEYPPKPQIEEVFGETGVPYLGVRRERSLLPGEGNKRAKHKRNTSKPITTQSEAKS